MGFHVCQCLEQVQDHPVMLAFAQLVPALPSFIWKLWLNPETFRVLLGEGESDFGTFSLRGLAVLTCGRAVLPCSGRAGTVTSSPSLAARLGSLVLTLIIPMARIALQLDNSKDPSLEHSYLYDITVVFFEIVHFPPQIQGLIMLKDKA